MSNRSPELVKWVTDVLDEIIPTIPVDDKTSDLITHVSRCVLKAAEDQTNYMTLFAVASAESTRNIERSSVSCRTIVVP